MIEMIKWLQWLLIVHSDHWKGRVDSKATRTVVLILTCHHCVTVLEKVCRILILFTRVYVSQLMQVVNIWPEAVFLVAFILWVVYQAALFTIILSHYIALSNFHVWVLVFHVINLPDWIVSRTENGVGSQVSAQCEIIHVLALVCVDSLLYQLGRHRLLWSVIVRKQTLKTLVVLNVPKSFVVTVVLSQGPLVVGHVGGSAAVAVGVILLDLLSCLLIVTHVVVLVAVWLLDLLLHLSVRLLLLLVDSLHTWCFVLDVAQGFYGVDVNASVEHSVRMLLVASDDLTAVWGKVLVAVVIGVHFLGLLWHKVAVVLAFELLVLPQDHFVVAGVQYVLLWLSVFIFVENRLYLPSLFGGLGFNFLDELFHKLGVLSVVVASFHLLSSCNSWLLSCDDRFLHGSTVF